MSFRWTDLSGKLQSGFKMCDYSEGQQGEKKRKHPNGPRETDFTVDPETPEVEHPKDRERQPGDPGNTSPGDDGEAHASALFALKEQLRYHLPANPAP